MSTPQFLVVDLNADSRFLLVKTLLRKFPGATIHECDDGEKALELARALELRAIIAHRTFNIPGIELVKRLRDADPEVPIIMVSGVDREAGAKTAGANAFVLYDEWLRIGTVTERAIQAAPRDDSEGSEVA